MPVDSSNSRISAIDGFNAIKEYAEHKPDLVLIDYMMPGITGQETIQKNKTVRSSCKIHHNYGI